MSHTHADHAAMKAAGRDHFRAACPTYVGEQGDIELRNCTCGTTLGYPLPEHEHEYIRPDGTWKTVEED